MAKKQVIIEQGIGLGNLLEGIRTTVSKSRTETKNVVIEQFFGKHPRDLKDKIIEACKMTKDAYNTHEDNNGNIQIENIQVGSVTVNELSLCCADITMEYVSEFEVLGVFDEVMEYVSEFTSQLID